MRLATWRQELELENGSCIFSLPGKEGTIRGFSRVLLLAIDVGQKRDPSAVAVLEVQERADASGRVRDHYVARHLERLPLGAPYPAVARRIAAIRANLRKRVVPEEYEPPTTYLDATGVGVPIVDLRHAAGVRVMPVFFNCGDRCTPREDGSVVLGKAFLVSQLQVLLQSGRILLPQTSEVRVLAQELQDFELKGDQDANEK